MNTSAVKMSLWCSGIISIPFGYFMANSDKLTEYAPLYCFGTFVALSSVTLCGKGLRSVLGPKILLCSIPVYFTMQFARNTSIIPFKSFWKNEYNTF